MSESKLSIPSLSLDTDFINQVITDAVESKILSAVENLTKDPVWLERIEKMVNQNVVQRVVASLGSMDINSVIRARVDENQMLWQKELLTNFSSSGIDDKASQVQLTVMDGHVVVENKTTTQELEVLGDTVIKNLVVRGSINTDNRSWESLANSITAKTLEQMDQQWKNRLVEQVKESIKQDGIQFDSVKIGGDYLVTGSRLSRQVLESNLQTVGVLRSLTVDKELSVNSTLHVINKRIGINTPEPDGALNIWDEEVSMVLEKRKAQEGFIGTNRNQSLSIGVNRIPQIELGLDGITGIKKLRLGSNQVLFGREVPNWSGTRGDIVFNVEPTVDNPVFAWSCLGGFKWKLIKTTA